ncbi:MAG: DUF692 domain-containing protein [Myxococcota bacterium]
MSPVRPRLDEAPDLGIGVGLRSPHVAEVLARARDGRLRADWFEVVSENYLVPGGRPLRTLEQVGAQRPLVMHGVSLDVGSCDPIDVRHVDALGALAHRIDAPWISDHLCWTAVDGVHLHDLLPLPFTEEAIRHVSDRVRRIQDRLGRRIALENVSSYFAWADDAMPEWEFVACVAEEADCGLLLDVNNVFVSAHNHGLDAERYLDAIPPERVFQIHLAGHSSDGPLLIDTHDHPVPDAVLALYARAVRRFGRVSTLIEWDDRLPPFERLEAEVERARVVRDREAPLGVAGTGEGAHERSTRHRAA